jgi:hypothetical protein
MKRGERREKREEAEQLCSVKENNDGEHVSG